MSTAGRRRLQQWATAKRQEEKKQRPLRNRDGDGDPENAANKAEALTARRWAARTKQTRVDETWANGELPVVSRPQKSLASADLAVAISLSDSPYTYTAAISSKKGDERRQRESELKGNSK
ncbi:hypothetical protein TARUN_10057 [Trichoderma arundinaceum]|uniref:Uncharacterized protein n=1 Tax=Trichoderma arundinaceum TaxID=490622 RepID=A0A395N955_TRIAR|nr:hypothetical protein TARUN_10057 [Trichoderma arundinaceum]